MSDALDVVSLFRHAFAGSVLVALVCGLLGVHVVARRIVLVGVALPQVAALGTAVALAVSAHEAHEEHAVESAGHLLVALLFTLAGVALIAWPAARRAIGASALAGLVFVVSGAVTILVMSASPRGMEEVHHLVEGNVLAVGPDDLLRLAWVLGAVLVVTLLGSRRLLFCTFDRETAQTLGIRTGFWEVVFYVLLAVTASAAVHAAGTLFVFSFLVLPGAAGVLLGRSGFAVFAVAAAVAIVGAAGGFVASASAWDTPTGPTCSAAATVLFLLCAGVAAVRARFSASSG